jgi:hypothetical protein
VELVVPVWSRWSFGIAARGVEAIGYLAEGRRITATVSPSQVRVSIVTQPSRS